MIKRTFILAVCLLGIKLCYAQNITDTIFKNVTKITEGHVVTNNRDFLFDVPIPKTAATPIVFIEAEVPLALLSNIYPEFSKIIVIVPNWKYYNEMATKKLPRGVVCAEPMASSIIYAFDRENQQLKKDSLVIMGSFPEMEFADQKLTKNQIEIYYKEEYGSVCCPKDLQWDNKPTRTEFIADFEKEHTVKISNTYYKSIGKEGEAVYFYTLSGLSNKTKLDFIVERNYARILNRHLKDIVIEPKIFTPAVIEKDATLEQL